MVGSLLMVEIERRTHVIFRNFNDLKPILMLKILIMIVKMLCSQDRFIN